jgi:hypothetical protein
MYHKNTKRIIMIETPKNENSTEQTEAAKLTFDKILSEAQQIRDELALQIHLGKMEAQDEFANLDINYEDFKAKSKEILKSAEETGGELGDAAKAGLKVAVNEFKKGYERIKNLL